MVGSGRDIFGTVERKSTTYFSYREGDSVNCLTMFSFIYPHYISHLSSGYQAFHPITNKKRSMNFCPSKIATPKPDHAKPAPTATMIRDPDDDKIPSADAGEPVTALEAGDMYCAYATECSKRYPQEKCCLPGLEWKTADAGSGAMCVVKTPDWQMDNFVLKVENNFKVETTTVSTVTRGDTVVTTITKTKRNQREIYSHPNEDTCYAACGRVKCHRCPIKGATPESMKQEQWACVENKC